MTAVRWLVIASALLVLVVVWRRCRRPIDAWDQPTILDHLRAILAPPPRVRAPGLRRRRLWERRR